MLCFKILGATFRQTHSPLHSFILFPKPIMLLKERWFDYIIIIQEVTGCTCQIQKKQLRFCKKVLRFHRHAVKALQRTAESQLSRESRIDRRVCTVIKVCSRSCRWKKKSY
jgi:hypothetical protein